MRRARTLIAVACAAASLAFAASAQADSIVYVKGGNVWLANPDGSGQYQVTLDGSPQDPYFSPTQANDGTIVAVRGKSPAKLYRMTQNGTLLNTPFATASPLGNVGQARVSPDGRLVAYSFDTVTNGCFPYGCAQADKSIAYTYADHLADPGGGLQTQFSDVSWMGSGRTALSGGGNVVYYDDVGGGDGSNAEWFNECDYYDCSNDTGADLYDAILSRQGDRVAVIRDFADPSNPYQLVYIPHMAVFPLSGNAITGTPPRPVTGCQVDGSAGQNWRRPTWAPDGSAVAWATDDGIREVTVPDANDCGTIGDRGLVIPGGFDPDWGPAPVAPAPRPSNDSTNTNTNPTPPPPPPAPVKVTLARVPAQKLGSLVAHGLKLRLRCASACSANGQLVLSAGSARKLHLAAKRRAHAVTIATGSAHSRRAGSLRLTVRVRRAYRSKLRRRLRHRRVTLTLRVTVRAAGASPRTLVRHVTLRG